MLTKINIVNAFKKIGVSKGDILVLQSSYKGCGEIENGPIGLIDALKELLGTEGTLIMPAYNHTMWTEHHYFDILETPSDVGVIAEVFRKCKDVGRTAHPVHSLCVWGRYKAEFESYRSFSSFDKDSIFSILHSHNVLYSTIGLGVKMPFLQVHYSEVLMNVSYRRRKDFAGVYVDKDRNPSLKLFNFHVRINQNDPVYRAHAYLLEKNLVKTHIVNNVIISYSRARDYHRLFTDYIKDFHQFFEA